MNKSKTRVAVYMRFQQRETIDGLIVKVNEAHYTELVSQHEDWTLMELYIDYSPNNAHRPEFERMLESCRAGNIDLIITRSACRFMHNIADGFRVIRELGELSPPVDVYFESENIHVLDDTVGAMLSLAAIEESRNKTEGLLS